MPDDFSHPRWGMIVRIVDVQIVLAGRASR
jgi:hypothetical protein